MHSRLLPLLFLIACSSSSSEDTSVPNAGAPADDTSASSDHDTAAVDTGADAEVELVEIVLSLYNFSGAALSGGSLCTADGCEDFTDGVGALEVPTSTEIDLWVEAEGSVNQHYQFVVDRDREERAIVLSQDELYAIASLYGVTLDDSKGFIAQFVDSQGGLTPELSTSADGPYFMSADGIPSALGATDAGGGFYAFFNVDPGEHEVLLPGCDEDESFWGEPGDGAISFAIGAGEAVGLFYVACD
jgi:hypothetical protein